MQRDEMVKRANELMDEYEAANATQKKLMQSHGKEALAEVQAEIAENERRAKGLILETVVDIVCIFARMADAAERIATVLENDFGGELVAEVEREIPDVSTRKSS
jgi:hypothetical protein